MSTGDEIESFYTPSWWTRRYTKETVVGIHLELINKKSEEVLRTIPCKLDVPYGSGPREKYNIIGTDLENDSPILIHVHGGYYQEERISHSSHAFIANALYKNHIKTITIGYELCPKKEVTEILTDLSAGIKECIKYGLSCKTRGIFLSGHSGGAHAVSVLFSKLCADLTEEEKHIVKGCFLISALYNIEKITEVSANQLLNLSTETAIELSPLLNELSYGTTKFYIIASEYDSPLFIKQAKQFQRKLKQNNVENELHIIAEVDHYDILENLYFEDFTLSKLIINSINKIK